jgi:hypothetical protein
MDVKTKELKHISAFIAEGKEAISEEDYSIEFVVSKEVVDRDNEIVLAEAVLDAIQRKNEFAANPICLPCHQHRLPNGMPPCVGSWVVSTARIKDKEVLMRLRFAVDTKLGETYWRLYSKRHMRAVSIEFLVLESRDVVRFNEVHDKVRIQVVEKIELYEISCVCVPSNREALSTLKSIGNWQEDREQRELEKTSTDIKELERVLLGKIDALREYLDDRIEELLQLSLNPNDLYLDEPAAEAAFSGRAADPAAQQRGQEAGLVILKQLEKILTKKG